MISNTDITVSDFKAHFTRDFQYGDTCEQVRDSDITKAMSEARACFNDSLFSTDEQLKIAFLYIVAHYLVYDLQTSQQGVGSTAIFPVVSRTVGSVSETYNVPLWLQHDPILSAFATTRYGLKYIALIKPLLIGGMQVFAGETRP